MNNKLRDTEDKVKMSVSLEFRKLERMNEEEKILG
jgi:hypothetical protein